MQVLCIAVGSRLQPRLHIGVGYREPLTALWQRVVVERGRRRRVDVPTQRHKLVVAEELPEHQTPAVGCPADEPLVVQAVAVDTEPCVFHADSADELDRES